MSAGLRLREPPAGRVSLSTLLPGPLAAPLADCQVSGVNQDSRLIKAGDLFLACGGLETHGLQFLQQARERGAVAVAWEPRPGIAPPGGLPDIAVTGLSALCGDIAARFFAHPAQDLFVVGITGTDGKTSCAWILAQALDRLGTRCGYLGTLGYGFADALGASMERASHTTPDAVRLQYWLAKLRANDASAVALEVSSHALTQGRVSGVAFDMAVLTNIGRDHLDYHGDLASYAAAKKALFEMPGLRAAILNQDDAHGREWLGSLPASVAGIGYGLEAASQAPAQRQLLATAVTASASGLHIDIDGSWGQLALHSPLLGRFNAYNLLACLAVLLEQGYAPDAAAAALAEVPTVPGRMQGITGQDAGGQAQPLVVVDYAHTPQALAVALQALREHCAGQLVCVFGCGGDRDKGKRPLMAQAAAQYADALIVTDDNPRSEAPAAIVADIVAGLPAACDYRVEHDRAAAIAGAIGQAGAGDVVLIAGKGHEDYQLIGAERRSFSDYAVASQILGGRH